METGGGENRKSELEIGWREKRKKVGERRERKERERKEKESWRKEGDKRKGEKERAVLRAKQNELK